MPEMCDHCGEAEAEYRDRASGVYCLECLRDNGQDEAEFDRL